MPRYKYLFEERPLLVRLDFQGAPGLDAALRPGQPRAADAFLLAANGTLVDASKTIGAADRELVPTHEARALVAYLLSLKTDAVLYETPMTVARRAAPAGTNASPGSALAAPGAPGASPPAPPTNAPAP
jgi:hypothetical protein